MAWDEEIVAIVRGLIQDYPDDDTGDPATYTDARLSTIILIAAGHVQTRLQLARTYKIRVEEGTISPDPTFSATRDETLINLSSLKAACILINAEVRQFTAQGISVRDGSSAVSLSRSPASLKLMKETYCSEYENAIYQYSIDGAGAGVLGEAIVGPVKAGYWNGTPYEIDFGMYGGPWRIDRNGGSGNWYGGGR